MIYDILINHVYRSKAAKQESRHLYRKGRIIMKGLKKIKKAAAILLASVMAVGASATVYAAEEQEGEKISRVE